MKKLLKNTILIALVFLGFQPISNEVCAQEKSDNEIIFMRPKRGMGQGIEHVLMVNGKEVGRLTNSSMLTYTVKEEGDYKLLIKMLLLGGPAGTPFAEKVTVKAGKPVYVDLRVTYAKIAEVVEDKKAQKIMSKCSYKTDGKE